MSCKKFQTQFDARLDERLDAAATVAFDAHLAGCATCRQEWQAYAGAWQTLARHEAISPSVGFADRALRRLEEDLRTPVRAPGLVPGLRWALVGVGAMAVMSLTWLNVQHLKTERCVRLYEVVHASEQIEDLDVIVYLHELEGVDQL